jgi:TRAP-type mannitol/chloroaromatic compound transport system permease small subunit
MQALIRGIGTFNEKVGFWTSLLILPMVAVVIYEVFMRYALNAPTSWAFEMTTFLYGLHFVLGFAFTHKVGGHVSVDIVEARLSAPGRTRLRIFANLVIFLPTVGLITIWSVLYAVTSWQQWELASSSWAPKVFPYKTLMALGFLLLWLQGVAKLLEDLRALNGPAARA